jgi:molecular chaperone DnaK (HSP70)
MTVVAIDLGTSNTLVAFLEPETNTPKSVRFPKICHLYKIQDKQGRKWQVPLIPSLVFIAQNQQLILGEQVKSQRLGIAEPGRYFKNFKRDLAADFLAPPRYLDGHSYDSKLIAELFIKEIWQYLKVQNIEPTQVIFTAPVGAFERYLYWFQDLGKRLGIPEIKIVDESTAAALGYAIKHPGVLVLVVDFGGGTLDLSLVKTLKIDSNWHQNNPSIIQAEVFAKSSAYIGGEDIDIWIVEDYLHQEGLSREEIGETSWQNLLEIAEKLKIRLSHQQIAQETWLDDQSFKSYELTLTRDKLEEILERQQLLEQLRLALDEVINLAQNKGINKREIERVLLVGGSCFIPAVKNLIVSYFGKNKVKFSKPFEAVCHGALSLVQIREISDYLQHTYAIRLWDPDTQNYTYFILFEKGLQYPCQREEPLFLQVANEAQTEIKLDIGELAEVSQAEVIYDENGQMSSSHLHNTIIYRSLETSHQQVCIAHLNPPGEVGMDRISVDFQVDENRILLVTVKDLLTKQILVEKQAITKLK